MGSTKNTRYLIPQNPSTMMHPWPMLLQLWLCWGNVFNPSLLILYFLSGAFSHFIDYCTSYMLLFPNQKVSRRLIVWPFWQNLLYSNSRFLLTDFHGTVEPNFDLNFHRGGGGVKQGRLSFMARLRKISSQWVPSYLTAFLASPLSLEIKKSSHQKRGVKMSSE